MTAEPQALKPADAVLGDWVDRVPPRVQPYLRLMRLDRPIGTWLLYWPCVFGLMLGATAADRPFTSLRDWWLIVLFGIGSIVMRGAGCTYNDIVDRDIDAKVARTRGRPIPSGAVTVRQAWLFLAAQLLIGLLILLQLNLFSIIMGAASLLLVAFYPFMKRITWWPQAWLGLTFNWGILLGYEAAQRWPPMLDLALHPHAGWLFDAYGDASVLLLYAAAVLWTLGYDTIYAVQDLEDDALAGVKSSARRLGEAAPRGVLIFYLIAIALAVATGVTGHLGGLFFAILALYAIHLARQAMRLKIDDPKGALALFKSNRDAGLILFAALIAGAWRAGA